MGHLFFAREIPNFHKRFMSATQNTIIAVELIPQKDIITDNVDGSNLYLLS
jgi:hypothetical protein